MLPSGVVEAQSVRSPRRSWLGLPKRVRLRQAATRRPDSQLQAFLDRKPPLDPQAALQEWREQAAGHWHDIEVAQEILDAQPLYRQMEQVARTQEDRPEHDEVSWSWRRDWVGLLCSLLFHLIALGLLLIWVQPRPLGSGPLVLQGVSESEALDVNQADLKLSALAETNNQLALENLNVPLPFQPTVAERPTRPPTVPDSPLSVSPSQMPASLSPTGGGITGRRTEERQRLVQQGGGSEDSERAVDWGLAYIAKHQLPDGDWSFTHAKDCTCENAGFNQTRTAATGLALLTFLGRNHNHVDESEYQLTVLKGLNYLIKASRDGDLTMHTGQGMYGQGIATLALAEAYAISKDPTLKKPAQEAVDFIVQAQHPQGGWRYQPGQIGDLNVTGWQLMALKTARLAGLEVPDETLRKAKSFVDSQAVSVGYLFTYPGHDPDVGLPTPTAIGLLLRMYEGWGRERDEIRFGIQYLMGKNVSANHMYFNYYATMVLFHHGGDPWVAWNKRMRDLLINSQATRGHQRGSWYFQHEKTSGEGGRLFNTAISVLILEVYYRHLRLYEDDALKRDFPLD